MDIDTNSRFGVYKVGERTFQIGEINYEQTFLKTFINLLDYGSKYISFYYSDNFSFFKNAIIDIDKEMINFNANIS